MTTIKENKKSEYMEKVYLWIFQNRTFKIRFSPNPWKVNFLENCIAHSKCSVNIMYLVLLYFHHYFIKTFKLSVYTFFLLNYLKCLYSLHVISISKLETLYLELGLKNNTKTLSGIGKSSNCMKFYTNNQKSQKACSPAQKFMFCNRYIISCWILKLFLLCLPIT